MHPEGKRSQGLLRGHGDAGGREVEPAWVQEAEPDRRWGATQIRGGRNAEGGRVPARIRAASTLRRECRLIRLMHTATAPARVGPEDAIMDCP